MRDQTLFDKIDLHLIRVLHTVLTERSVSRAAVRLGMHQPAVSAALKRLRELSGDPLLVRSGSAMVPTDAALRMIEPSASILRAAEVLFSDARGFEPRSTDTTFRIAASDYLDPLFLPRLVAQVKQPGAAVPIEIHPLSGAADYQAQLAQGDIDLVVGNWLRPPDDLHMGRLFDDEVVSPGLRAAPGGAPRLGQGRLAGGRPHVRPRPPIPARAASSTSTWTRWACSAQHHGALPRTSG
jgi:DNA-binding transcriptional LysR family regulator